MEIGDSFSSCEGRGYDMVLGDRDLAVLSSLEDPIRARLYEVVSTQPDPVRRDDAAAAVGVGRSVAAYHLDRMVELGLLTATYRRPAGQHSGRPAKVYTRSSEEFAVMVPHRAYEFAAQLMAETIAAGQGDGGRSTLPEVARAHGLQAGQARRDAVGPQSDPRRVLEGALRDYGFEPTPGDGGAIHLGNCPFHHLSERWPGVVCAMNFALVDGLNAAIGAEGHPVLSRQPGRCCVTILADSKTPVRHASRRRLALHLSKPTSTSTRSSKPPA